jgi:hypothetical protein
MKLSKVSLVIILAQSYVDGNFPMLSEGGFGKYIIIPNVISYISDDLFPIFRNAYIAQSEEKLQNQIGYERIFDSYQDSTQKKVTSKRFSKKCTACPDCVKPFEETLKLVLQGIPGYHSPNGYSCIFSLPGCTIQRHHVDYPQLVGTNRKDWPTYLPLVVIIALEENVSILVEDHQVPIPIFSALIMRADVVHQGNNYRHSSGIRLHFYIDYSNYINSDGLYNGFINLKQWRLQNNQKRLLSPPESKKRKRK